MMPNRSDRRGCRATHHRHDLRSPQDLFRLRPRKAVATGRTSKAAAPGRARARTRPPPWRVL